MHGLYWLKDAPKFDEDNESSFQTCCNFIDNYISCTSEVEGVLHQTHKHTSNCEVKFKDGKKCRYGMPYPPMSKTRILLPFPVKLDSRVKESAKCHLQVIKLHTEDLYKRNIEIDYESFLDYLGLSEHQYLMAVRSGIIRPTVFLQRTIKDAFYNAFNPDLARAWRANMDIQFILDAYACCKYCAAYVSKSCRGMSELLRKVVEETKGGNVTCKEKLKRIAHTFLNGSEVSAQEAAYTVLGMPLSKASRSCIYINTSKPAERVKIMKTAKELQELPPDSIDVCVEGLLDHYISRPNELEQICLAEFAAYWRFSKCKPNSGKRNLQYDQDYESDGYSSDEEMDVTFYKVKGGYIKLRTKARVIRFRNFSFNSGEEDFHREQLMLYKPWRNERFELLVEDLKERYQESLVAININRSKYHQQLNISREDIQNVDDEEDEIDYQIDNEYEVLNNPDLEGDFGLEIGDKNKRKDVLKMPGMIDDDSYKSLIEKLNAKQLKYHTHVLSRIGIVEEPLYEFVCGGAGVGKSMLIKAITQSIIKMSVTDVGKDPSRIRILLCAPTGVASYNISGYTLHQAFGLPFSQFDGTMPRLTESNRSRLAKEFQDLDLIIIDEISMTSREQLFQIDERLRQIFKTSYNFGGKSIIAVGDFNQFEPVMASYIFAEPRKGLELLGYNYLWPLFKFYELTECMRQREDKAFAEALNRLSVGQCTDEDIKMFKTREISLNNLVPPETAIRLKYTNNDVQKYNSIKLANVLGEGCISQANDRVQGIGKKEHHEAIRKRAKELLIQKTHGLPLEVQLKLGMRYMMTVNADTSDGLVNGAIGTLRNISYGTTTDRKKVALNIWIELLGDTGKKRRDNYLQKLNKCVPIMPEMRTIYSWPGKQLEVVRSQFAVVVAEAISIHKSQGSTFGEVVLSVQYHTKTMMKKNIPRRGLYVGMSRCTSLSGLYIDGEFNAPSLLSPNDPVVIAMHKLRAQPVFEEDFIPIPQLLHNHLNFPESGNKICIETQPGSFITDLSCAKKTKEVLSSNFLVQLPLSNDFFKIVNYGGSLRSFGTFAPGSQADDVCMNGIGTALVMEHATGLTSWIDSLFVSCASLINEENRNSEVCYTALNPEGDHWILAKLDRVHKSITLYDSLRRPLTRYMDLIDAVKSKLLVGGIDLLAAEVSTENTCSRQQGTNDCGPMTLLFLKRILIGSGVNTITAEDATNFRMEFGNRMLISTNIGRRYLFTNLSVRNCYVEANRVIG